MSTTPYQPFYCEENIWHLCDQLDLEQAYTVFISNARRTCALWSQRAARDEGAPVIWDYHVILVDDSQPNTQVWDLDTLIGAPAPFDAWWQATFPFEDTLPRQFQPRFRIVPATEYLERFSSDRSHMRTDDGQWQAPPPEWEPIFRPEEGMNLNRFIEMSDEFVGEVANSVEMLRQFGSAY